MLRALFVAVFVAASAGAADIPLLPPPEPGPVPAWVTTAAAGNAFLAAWTTDDGICARRVSSAGTTLDDPPLCFDRQSGIRRSVAVVGGDDRWTLFWIADAGLRAARIALDGRLLDAAPKQLDVSTSAFGVARDGAGFVIARGDGRLSLVDGGLTTIRDVGNTGESFGNQIEAAASGQGYLAAIDEHLTFFDTAGRVLAKMDVPVGVNGRHIASAGGAYLVAWVVRGVYSISMAVFDNAGKAIAAPRTITPLLPGRYIETLAVVADGIGYTLVDAELDQNERVQHFRGFRFAANGAQIETYVTPDVDAGLFQPLYFVMGLAHGSGGYFLVTVSNPRGYGQGWAFGSLAAIPSAPQIASLAFGPHAFTAAAIAADDDGFVAAWLENVPPPSDGGRSGGIVHFSVGGGAAMELDRGPLSAPLALASGGGSSLVAWTAIAPAAVRARLLRRDGTSSDLTLPARAFVESITAAWCGSAYVVAWSEVGNSAYAVAITPDGGARDTQRLGTAPPDGFLFNRDLSAACSENGCLFAGIMGRTLSSSDLPLPYAIATVRFDRGGNAVAPMHFFDIPADRLGLRPFFDGSGHAYVLYGRVFAGPLDGLAVAAVNEDGSLRDGGTQLAFSPHDDPLLATELGFYSVHDDLRLYWTWLTLTPKPGIAGQVDLGVGFDVVGVAVRGSSAMALVRDSNRTSLALREIPSLSPKRRRPAGSR